MGEKCAQTKVVFPYNEAAETMWCDPLGGEKYRLDNVPLFAYGVSFGDVFRTKNVEGDDRPYFDVVTERSNNWTYRLILNAIPQAQVAERDRLLNSIIKFGDITEKYDDLYVSVNVPRSVGRQELDRAIERGEHQGFWKSEVSSGPDLEE